MDTSGKGKVYLIPSWLGSDSLAKEVFPEQNGEIIKSIDYFLVEELKTARRFISSLKLGLTIEDLTFHQLDKRTSEDEVIELMMPVLSGKNIGIISEAGCPGIADPGSGAVQFAHENLVEVIPLVGPSSILLVLMASGLNGQGFTFNGYLPIKENERKKALKDLEIRSAKTGRSQIFMETPYRNKQMLSTIVSSCNKNTRLTIGAGIHTTNQFIRTLPLYRWTGNLPNIHKIPAIFILQS